MLQSVYNLYLLQPTLLIREQSHSGPKVLSGIDNSGCKLISGTAFTFNNQATSNSHISSKTLSSFPGLFFTFFLVLSLTGIWGSWFWGWSLLGFWGSGYILKAVWIGGLGHLFWPQIWNLQVFLPLMGNIHQICPALAEILQHTDTKRIKYGQSKFMESLSLDDNAKSHLEHGTICCNINLKHNFWKGAGWLRLKLPITVLSLSWCTM